MNSNTSSDHRLAHTNAFLVAHLLLDVAILGGAHALVHIARLADLLPDVPMFGVDLHLFARLTMNRAHPLAVLVRNLLVHKLAVRLAYPLAFFEGTVNGLRNPFDDITARKEVEAALLRFSVAHRWVNGCGCCGKNGDDQGDGKNAAGRGRGDHGGCSS